MSGYPVDDLNLRLLAEACRINEDTGQTHLGDFLEMGTRVASVRNEETGETFATMEEAVEAADEDVPTFFVEYAPGHEPHSPQSVILSLVGEIERLRGRAVFGGTTQP